MTPWILSSVGLVLLAALAGYQFTLARVVLRTLKDHSPPPAPTEPYDDAWIVEGFERSDRAQGEVLLAVDEGIKHVDRAEKRIRAIANSAQRRMEKAGIIDAGVEAEADQIRGDDDGPRGVEPVQPVPENLVPFDQRAWDSVPGLTP